MAKSCLRSLWMNRYHLWMAPILEPGEMVLYESAKLPHGRQIPFQGEFYDNLFAHFYPEDLRF